MKIQVRRGVFETNSSSVHCFETADKHLFDLWKAGKAFWNGKGIMEAAEKHYKERREQAPDYIKKLEDGTVPCPTGEDMESLKKLRYFTWDEYCCMFRRDPGGVNGVCGVYGIVEQEYTDAKGRPKVFFGWSGYP
ncbi:hypothetical protein [Breznakiella homolactica]|uniref:Uncharacterized protein n=1 Tax=Breznakiella homolactica TaxID=2798577 RepID=A0A7T8B9W0_9SPIR|nr:hypothetical protein [Breznakiella homolactica]QQO07593.1 hypothetical protein JFL75_11615 [Breznakiella homolactica]